MVSNEVVLQTVKRMLSSGIDEQTIKQTLLDINLSEEEIQNVLNTAKGISAQTKNQPTQTAQKNNFQNTNVQKNQSAEKEDFDEAEVEESEEELGDEDEAIPVQQPSQEIKKEFQNVSQEQAAQHSTTHSMLEEHSGKIEDVGKSINDLHEKFDSSPKLSPETIANLETFNSRLAGLEKEILETKANTKALQTILEKILETNRKTLLELQKKK